MTLILSTSHTAWKTPVEHGVYFNYQQPILTDWGRVTQVCVGKLTIIGSDTGLSSGRRRTLICTYIEILLMGPQGTNFNEILIEIHTFSYCVGLIVLRRGSLIFSKARHQLFTDHPRSPPPHGSKYLKANATFNVKGSSCSCLCPI